MSIEAAIILATLMGPVLAIQAQKLIERATERRNAKKRIFYALMATRAARVAAEHVQALNMIDLEFGKGIFGWWPARDKEVTRRWRIYADQLNLPFDEDDQTSLRNWVDRGDELFTDLLDAMAKALGYDFDRVQLRRGIYYPKAHSEAERRREVFDKALVRIVTGEDALPMKVTELPVNEDAAALQVAVYQRILNSYNDQGALTVRQVE